MNDRRRVVIHFHAKQRRNGIGWGRKSSLQSPAPCVIGPFWSTVTEICHNCHVLPPCRRFVWCRGRRTTSNKPEAPVFGIILHLPSMLPDNQHHHDGL
jgi:hypothetical protein